MYRLAIRDLRTIMADCAITPICGAPLFRPECVLGTLMLHADVCVVHTQLSVLQTQSPRKRLRMPVVQWHDNNHPGIVAQPSILPQAFSVLPVSPGDP